MLDAIVDIVVDAIGAILMRDKDSNKRDRAPSPTTLSDQTGLPAAPEGGDDISAPEAAACKSPRRHSDRDDIDVLRAGP